MKVKKKYPILFFADKLPPLFGGMEIHAKFFIEYFKDHEFFPICGVISKDKEGKDVEVFSRGSKPSLTFFNSGAWIEELERKMPSFYRTGGNEILKAPLKQKISCHEGRQRHWINQINKHIDVLITNSTFTTERLKALGVACAMEKIVGGVETGAINPHNPEEGRLFCAARFVAYKNHEFLIDILNQLIQRGNKLHLVLAGEGPLLGVIQKKVANYQLENSVTFLGPLTNEEVFIELSKAQFYIQLSTDYEVKVEGGHYIHTECMGRSFLEAISAGVYIIANDTGALSEIIRNDRGVLLRENMIEKIEKLFKIRPKGTSTTEYDWKNVFKEYEKLFRKFL